MVCGKWGGGTKSKQHDNFFCSLRCLSFSAAAKQVAEKLFVLSAAAKAVPFQIKIRNKIKIKIKGSGQECPLYTKVQTGEIGNRTNRGHG